MSRIRSRIAQHILKNFVSRRICFAWPGLCVVLGVLISTPVFAQADAAYGNTTFLIVRHAEREGNLDKLTETGTQRAQLLASVGKALNVRAVYSTDFVRTKTTAQPLAQAIDAEINIYKTPGEDWIASLLQKHSGQVVLIVGHSNTAGLIAGRLAKEKAFEIAHDEYDALFIVQVSDRGTRAMRLRYGNSNQGASSADADNMGVVESPGGAK